jgi:hypothetical protein
MIYDEYRVIAIAIHTVNKKAVMPFYEECQEVMGAADDNDA